MSVASHWAQQPQQPQQHASPVWAQQHVSPAEANYNVGAIVAAAVQEGVERALASQPPRQVEIQAHSTRTQEDRSLWIALALVGLVLVASIASTLVGIKHAIARASDMAMWSMMMRMQMQHPMYVPAR